MILTIDDRNAAVRESIRTLVMEEIADVCAFVENWKVRKYQTEIKQISLIAFIKV